MRRGRGQQRVHQRLVKSNGWAGEQRSEGRCDRFGFPVTDPKRNKRKRKGALLPGSRIRTHREKIKHPQGGKTLAGEEGKRETCSLG